jgi:uncharacterized membrane protein
MQFLAIVGVFVLIAFIACAIQVWLENQTAKKRELTINDILLRITGGTLAIILCLTGILWHINEIANIIHNGLFH